MGSGPFADWKIDKESWKGDDPLLVWDAFEMREISELCHLAKLLLSVIVNQAGCERLFSDLGNTQGTRRTQLGIQKLEKMTKVSQSVLIVLQPK